MGILDAPALGKTQADTRYARRIKLTGGSGFQPSARGSGFAIGVDEVDNLGWFTTTSLFSSTDNLALTTQPSPAGINTSSMGKVVRFGANIYLIAQDTASGLMKVYQSIPPSAGTVAWTPVLSMVGNQSLGTSLEKSKWATGTNYLFAGDYGDPVGGPSLWRTADGTTWTKVLGPIAGLRHFHAVAADPYVPGVVYLTAGDGNSKVLAKSTDSGATWTWIITNNTFQAVQISFSANWVWFAGDQGGAITVWVLDRTDPTPTPIIASMNHHAQIPVPGGLPGRGPFTDGALSSGSATFTSATANFTANDVGRMIRFITLSAPISDASGIYISAYVNSTTVTLNKTAGGTSTGRPFCIDGEIFARSAFYGAVDPATEIYYCVSNDLTSGGYRTGLFYLPYVGGRLELLEAYSDLTTGVPYFRNGSLWAQRGIHPLLAVAP